MLTNGRTMAGVEDSDPVASPTSATPLRTFSEWDILLKNTLDYSGALLLIGLMLPALCVIAVAIRLDSKGPILFRQPRIGRDNQAFTCFKFRTMYQHVGDVAGEAQTKRDDPRITRVGRWLRRFSIDETAQLFNIIRGEMSLVGPRPHAVGTKADGRSLSELVADYDLRHQVKPGITGWAQVNGRRGPVHTIDDIRYRVEYDLDYIARWSVFFDLQILFMTARSEILSRHAY